MILGFRLSPVNQYQRPWYEKYPGDTFINYKLQLIRSLQNPRDRVIILEDSYHLNKSSWIPAAFPKNLLQEKRRNKIIISVIISTGFQPKEVPKDNSLIYDYLIQVVLILSTGCLKHLSNTLYTQGRDKNPSTVESYEKQTKP